tara:strand:+ start:1205 stop:1909 length:705 start_codon:yes stop_codon:yes gene_type:complete
MDTLIHLIQNVNTDCNLSNKIKIHKFTENNFEREKSYHNLVFCILDNYDPILSNALKTDKKLFFNQRISEICSQIEENPSIFYDKFKYNKRGMSIQDIQISIQSSINNNIQYSALNYLNDLYKTHFVLIDSNKKEYYETSPKNYNKKYIYFRKNNYELSDTIPSEFVNEEINKCSFVTLSTKKIYESYLMPMNKYKLNELHDEAVKINMNTQQNGKSKLKKVLYEEINNYYLNN